MPSKTASFPDYIRQNLERSGYKTIQQTAGDVFMRTPDDGNVWICYLDAAITPEDIRRAFEFKGHLLFVVDDKVIPQDITDRQSTPMWLRVIHGLYMGRVYTWNGRFLYGLHFDYDTGDIFESGIINSDELLLIETGTWLRGWANQYKLARFYDRAWWTEKGDSGYQSAGYTDWKQGKTSSSRQSYEQARDSYWQQQRAREKAQRTRYDSSGWAYDPNDWPNGKPPDPPRKEPMRDFGKEFRACDNLAEVKTLYRKLAQKYHPDISGYDSNAEMAAINVAYERAKLVYA